MASAGLGKAFHGAPVWVWGLGGGVVLAGVYYVVKTRKAKKAAATSTPAAGAPGAPGGTDTALAALQAQEAAQAANSANLVNQIAGMQPGTASSTTPALPANVLGPPYSGETYQGHGYQPRPPFNSFLSSDGHVYQLLHDASQIQPLLDAGTKLFYSPVPGQAAPFTAAQGAQFSGDGTPILVQAS